MRYPCRKERDEGEASIEQAGRSLFTSAYWACDSRIAGGEGIAFMHGIHGSDHHMLALAKAEGPGLHHLSWDVGSIDEIGLGAMQMADKGFRAGWGLGRHVLGSNYFHYVRDPWGSYSEYSAAIDYIPANCDWQAEDNPGHDSFYAWGPIPPADFTVNHEIK